MVDTKAERDEKDTASAVKRTAEPDADDSVKDNEKSKKKEYQDDEDEGEPEGEEYEVEKVVGHKRERGVLSFLLKWQGYGDADNTWEASDNLSCGELINEYWERYEKAGGKKSDAKGSEKAQAAKRSNSSTKAAPSRKSTTPTPSKKKREEEDEPPKVSSTKKQKVDGASKSDSITKAKSDTKAKSGTKSQLDDNGDERTVEKWTPPKSWTSWDEHLEEIQTIERSNRSMVAHLNWKNGKETIHPIEVAHVKCPQTLIRFYESHLKFTQA